MRSPLWRGAPGATGFLPHTGKRFTAATRSARELKTLNHLLERIALSILDAEGGEAGLCLKCGAYCSESCAFHGRHGVCPYGQKKGR